MEIRCGFCGTQVSLDGEGRCPGCGITHLVCSEHGKKHIIRLNGGLWCCPECVREAIPYNSIEVRKDTILIKTNYIEGRKAMKLLGASYWSVSTDGDSVVLVIDRGYEVRRMK